MKIKHWQGYGTVNAVKVNCDRGEVLHIKVTGDHEYGLERDDMYDATRWLAKRFDKSITSDNERDWRLSHFVELESVSFSECHYRFYVKER